MRCTAALAIARAETERPSFIQVRSHIAYPAPNAVDTAKAHGAPLGEDEVRATKEAMGFDPELKFHVDERVYEHMSLRESGREFQEEWEGRARAWSERYPQLVEEWERAWSGRLRDGWREALPSFKAGEAIATRSAGQKTMSTISAYGPTMAGGAADLVESTKTTFEGAGEFSRVHVGRNIPFGIREHAMGAIVNGLAAHGGMVKPYGSTFLVFSDYMRASVRLSALDGAAGAVGVDARLRRPGRGRAHAPAGRALRRPARDPAPVGDASRRRERDRAGLEAGARARGRARRAVALAPEPAGAGPRGGWRGRGLGAGRRMCCGSPARTPRRTGRCAAGSRRVGWRRWASAPAQCCGRRGRCAGDDVGTSVGPPPTRPDRDRLGGRADARGRARAGAGGHARARRLDAVHGAVRSAVGRVPRQRDPARRRRAWPSRPASA